jgi:hypothetical protein
LLVLKIQWSIASGLSLLSIGLAFRPIARSFLMAKALLALLDMTSTIHAAIIDLEFFVTQPHELPKLSFDEQKASITEWIRSDLYRTACVIDSVEAGMLNAETIGFLTRLSELLAIAPAATEAPDLLIVAARLIVHIDARKPQDAKATWDRLAKMRRAPDPLVHLKPAAI